MYFLFLAAVAIFSSAHCAHVNSVDTNVVGGEEVTIEDFKYQVAVLKDRQLWCGGSIITNKHVLTAGHCFSDLTNQFDTLTVRAGSSFWAEGGSLHDVESAVAYVSDLKSEKTHYNIEDLGLITVVQPFEFDKTRQPVPLATYDTNEPDGAYAVASGWGTVGDGTFPSQLRAAEVPLVPKINCSLAYGGAGLSGISASELCAGDSKKTVCSGDYGGPLVLSGVLVGVSTYSHGCGDLHFPGIYSDVAYFQKWIKEEITKGHGTN